MLLLSVIVSLVLFCTVSENDGDIADFCVPDPSLFNPNFGVFPLHQIAEVGVSLCIKP